MLKTLYGSATTVAKATFIAFTILTGTLLTPAKADTPAPYDSSCTTFTPKDFVSAAGIQGLPQPIDLKGEAYGKFIDAFEAATRPGNRPSEGDEIVLVHTPGVGWVAMIFKNGCALAKATLSEEVMSKVLDTLGTTGPILGQPTS